MNTIDVRNDVEMRFAKMLLTWLYEHDCNSPMIDELVGAIESSVKVSKLRVSWIAEFGSRLTESFLYDGLTIQEALAISGAMVERVDVDSFEDIKNYLEKMHNMTDTTVIDALRKIYEND